MAKKKDTPSLKSKRVWDAISAGSLIVKDFSGTKILHVIRGRVRLTWVEKGDKKHVRIRLRRVYLNPKWIPLPKDFPIAKDVLQSLSVEDLCKLGIVCPEEGTKDDFRLLIYQQLDDLHSLSRQISKHIIPRHEKEEEKLWRRLEKTLLWDPARQTGKTSAKDNTLFRLKRTGTIKAHMTGRKEAVQYRIDFLRKIQQRAKDALGMLFELIPMAGENNIKGTVKGLRNSLSRNIELLEQLLDDSPYYHRAKWAKYHIGKARVYLAAHDFDKTKYHFRKAIEHLELP